MRELPNLLLKIRKATNPLGKEIGVMSIIIRRPYARLEKELREVFGGQENVNIVVDQRNGDRRTELREMENERRRSPRRTGKEEMERIALEQKNVQKHIEKN